MQRFSDESAVSLETQQGGVGFLFDLLVSGKHFIYEEYFFIIIQLYRLDTLFAMGSIFTLCSNPAL